MSDERCDIRIPYAWLKPIIGLLVAGLLGGSGSQWLGAPLRREQAQWDTEAWEEQREANQAMLEALRAQWSGHTQAWAAQVELNQALLKRFDEISDDLRCREP